MNNFSGTGCTEDDIVNLIVADKSIIAFALDMQNTYRIHRAMGKDPDDELLHKAAAMDDIIIEIKKLEQRLMDIRAERKKAEQPEETVE